jgi:AcrR family transcriptional regulator
MAALPSSTAPAPAKPPKKAVAEGSTRQAILDAAQKRLARLGADGLRLQDIARDVGVSHPTILHHFGSRDGLIVAMVQHIGEAFVSEIIRRIPLGTAPIPNDVSKVGLAYDLLADKGFGGLIGWAFRQRPADIAPVTENLFNMAFESMVQHKAELDGAPPDEAWQTQLAYSIRLTLMAAAGETLIGKPIGFARGNYADFQVWIGNVIADRVGI